MCDTNKIVIKMGVIIKGVYYTIHGSFLMFSLLQRYELMNIVKPKANNTNVLQGKKSPMFNLKNIRRKNLWLLSSCL